MKADKTVGEEGKLNKKNVVNQVFKQKWILGNGRCKSR